MKTFKEMTPEERSDLVEHMVATGSIQVLGKDGQWYGSENVCNSRVYRIPVTKPSIDWSAVHTDYKWLARDGSGEGYLFRSKPNRVGMACFPLTNQEPVTGKTALWRDPMPRNDKASGCAMVIVWGFALIVNLLGWWVVWEMLK